MRKKRKQLRRSRREGVCVWGDFHPMAGAKLRGLTGHLLVSQREIPNGLDNLE